MATHIYTLIQPAFHIVLSHIIVVKLRIDRDSSENMSVFQVQWSLSKKTHSYRGRIKVHQIVEALCGRHNMMEHIKTSKCVSFEWQHGAYTLHVQHIHIANDHKKMYSQSIISAHRRPTLLCGFAIWNRGRWMDSHFQRSRTLVTHSWISTEESRDTHLCGGEHCGVKLRDHIREPERIEARIIV